MWRFWYWKSTSHTGTKFSEIKYNKFHLVIAELHTPPPRAKMKEPNKLDFYPTHFFNACNYLVVFIFVGCCCCNNVSLKPLSPTPLPSLDTCMSLWMMRNFKTLTISMRRRGGGCHDFYFYRISNVLIEIQILGTKPEVHAEICINSFKWFFGKSASECLELIFTEIQGSLNSVHYLATFLQFLLVFQVCKQTFYCNECFNSFKVSMSCKRILMFLRNNDGLIIPTVLIFLNSNDKHVKRS